MPVHSADTHAGSPGYLVDGDRQALCGKDLLRRLEDLGPVTPRIRPEGP
jgi:hypothetical protein